MKKRATTLTLKLTSMVYLLVCVTGVSAIAQADQVDAFLKREVKALRIPGLQVAVVQSGKIVLSKSYGYANLQDSILVDNKTIFAINSCTKSFTGVAIMQLVEEGKIDLSAPVSRYLDYLPAEWQSVTIKQLLTHISGIPDIGNVLDPYTHGLGALKNETAAWEKVKTMRMQFPTGTQFSYNQTNYALLGKIIDKLAGKPFTQVYKERQFQIANMPHTVFGDSRDIIPHVASTYIVKTMQDGQKLNEEKLTNNYSEFPAFHLTASGLNSTAEDMANWIIALQHGKLLKTKEALTAMWTAGTYVNGLSTQWALGWGYNKFRPTHWAVGMTGGSRSAFLVYPDDDLAIIILTNLASSYPENLIDELAGYYNPDIAAADPITTLRMQLKKRGFENAITVFNELKKKDVNFKPSEYEMNDWGYRMMSSGQVKEACGIFKLNVFIYPESWNAYDSYGEALFKNGQKEEASTMYKRSIELNPDNKGGQRMLDMISKP
jgi:CubicO group peptidase (beta-lactamase class C family)